MPNRLKWGDFTPLDPMRKPHKQHGKWEVTYARFACPYSCGHIVDLSESSVVNNKSTECRSHLMVCAGTNSKGEKACEDPRVKWHTLPSEVPEILECPITHDLMENPVRARARAHSELGAAAEALENARQATALCCRTPEGWRMLAQAAEACGDAEAATAARQQCVLLA